MNEQMGEQKNKLSLIASEFFPRIHSVLGVWIFSPGHGLFLSPLPSMPGKCLELLHSLMFLWIMWLFLKGHCHLISKGHLMQAQKNVETF